MGEGEGNRPLGRPGSGWKYNIRIYLKKISLMLSWSEMVRFGIWTRGDLL